MAASIMAVALFTAGTIRSFPRLPRWSSPWWVLFWAAAAWLPMSLLLLIGQLGLPKNVDLGIVLVYAAWDWVPALSLSAIGFLLVWVARTAVAVIRGRLSPAAE
jgi:hypothetical protein